MSISSSRRIKWSYATRIVPGKPETLTQSTERLGLPSGPPAANDVVVAEVVEIGQHTRIEYDNGARSQLFGGDLLGLAFGHRYATRQWRGRVPDSIETFHMLSIGGLCGEVVDMSPIMEPPTIVKPLGYLLNGDSTRANLTHYGLEKRALPQTRPKAVLVVGSSMDSGKTTAAFSIINGLSKSGAKVSAAKLTGTASAKDVLLMHDAGAARVLDFSDAGHASTAECDVEELRSIATSILAELVGDRPEYVVLEIADGVVQRETDMLLRELHNLGCVDYTVYTCNDTLGVREGLRILREIGMNVVAVSGWVACSPLAAQEAQAVSDLPVLQPEDLMEPGVVELFSVRDTTAKLSFPIQRAFARSAVGVPRTTRAALAG